ncbi:pickpocket protein 28-like [Bombyx mandarina]|uniref:Pickpocket protein 28-like n=1 Tax=Bombyx mandarina TaxID=7092 RepID=A0A6J2K8G4_BOMMA|nr:pickpocket protein 28-like [Bombyx mandarina]
MQINANCKVNQVPFPAVSLCNFNVVSLKESKNIETVLKRYNITDDRIHKFFNGLAALKDNVKQSNNFTEILAILKHHYFTMDTIMEEVHQKCENLLIYCSFNRKEKRCDNLFSLIKTYEGYCCTFNYAALNDASEVPLLPPDEDLEYYEDQNQDALTQTSGIITTSESGGMSGLSVVFNVEPGDYPSWSPIPYYGVKVLISDPNDYPETTVLYRFITLGESVAIKVDPMVFQSESNIRRVVPDKRACWFHDEVILGHTDRYSFETCHTECKMKTYLDTCGCIPFKYPREKSTRICEFEDLNCLNNVTVYKSRENMDCKPMCYMECQDKKYSITSDLLPFLPEDYPNNVS